MTVQEAQQRIQEIKQNFTSQNGLIDLTTQSITLEQAKSVSELNMFFELDEDTPYSEFLKSGLKSLRPGFYKIDSNLRYNTSIYPGTYSATVLYIHPANNRVIKYDCNIGPITNIYKRYKNIVGSPISINQLSILKKFEEEKLSIGNQYDDYMIPKKNFFESIYYNNKIFFVIESIWEPDYPKLVPRPKRVTWSFTEIN